ncbi:DUF6417 family protein [Streptomyces sp. NPDC057889]|uniref:DUF6417 family protein n=1 Tax=unclassified Streptomyces TaxID=2593676 RepID=UPI003678A079
MPSVVHGFREQSQPGSSTDIGRSVRVLGQHFQMPLVLAVVTQDMNSDATSLPPAQDTTARRLEMLTLDEAHDLLRLLQLIAAEGLDELSEEAEWFAREIAARIPSEN